MAKAPLTVEIKVKTWRFRFFIQWVLLKAWLSRKEPNWDDIEKSIESMIFVEIKNPNHKPAVLPLLLIVLIQLCAGALLAHVAGLI